MNILVFMQVWLALNVQDARLSCAEAVKRYESSTVCERLRLITAIEKTKEFRKWRVYRYLEPSCLVDLFIRFGNEVGSPASISRSSFANFWYYDEFSQQRDIEKWKNLLDCDGCP